LPLFLISSFIPIVPISIMGIKKSEKIFLLFGFLIIIPALLWPVQEPRYLLAAYFLIVYLALMYLKDKRKDITLIFMIITVLFQFGTTASILDTHVVSYGLLDDAGIWLRENTDPNSIKSNFDI